MSKSIFVSYSVFMLWLLPKGLRKYVRVCLELSRSELSYSYAVHELQVPDTEFPHDWEVILKLIAQYNDYDLIL